MQPGIADSTSSPEKPLRWQLSDLLWFSVLFPPCAFWVANLCGGGIYFSSSFDEETTRSIGVDMAVCVSVQLLASFLGFLLLTYLFPTPNALGRRARLLASLGVFTLLIAPYAHSRASSRMPRNESAAIGACKTFASAEDIFRRTDWNRNGVLEYATSLQDLYGNGKIGLVSKAFADAEGRNGKPQNGYRFKVLTAQFFNPRGQMTVGYALLAWPAAWDRTGRNCFLISSSGTVAQEDHGQETQAWAEACTEFNPKNPGSCFGE